MFVGNGVVWTADRLGQIKEWDYGHWGTPKKSMSLGQGISAAYAGIWAGEYGTLWKQGTDWRGEGHNGEISGVDVC